MQNTFFISLILFSFSLTVYAQSDTINRTDAQGRKQGYWEKHDAEGNLVYQGFFSNNKPVGEMKRYYETGEIKAILKYRKNSETVKTQFFYDTGEVAAEGLYIGNKKDSIWHYYSYYTGALTSAEMYSNGVKQGMEKKFYPNGKVSEEVEWKDDIKNGIWNQYFEDGTPKLKASFLYNTVNGPYTFYWPNGTLYIKGTFVDNKREGKWYFYTDEGKLKSEISYINGKAENEEEIIARDQEFFRMVDQNIGKFEEPTLEDVSPGGNIIY